MDQVVWWIGFLYAVYGAAFENRALLRDKLSYCLAALTLASALR